MPQRARYLCAAVVAAAAAVAALILPGTHWAAASRAPFAVLLSLQVLLVLTNRLPLYGENPAGPALVSVLLASIMLLPPGVAAFAAVAASSFMVLRRADPLRVAFSGAVAFLATAAGGEVYLALHGCTVLTAGQFPGALVPIALAAVVISVIPAVLVQVYLVQAGRHGRDRAWREAVLRAARNVGYSFVGLLTAVLWSYSYDALAALVLLGPVVVTRWATLQYEEQRTAHTAIISTLVQAVEIKDLYTRGHSERVARISEMIAGELRLPADRVDVLRYAATLHDVGKLGVPTRLLRKTGRLTEDEFEEIRLHPSRGVEVVRDIRFLDEAYSAILHHHERMDGCGYPSGLRGMRIPPFARIIAVADAFDSMTSTRSYRGARGSDEALTELRACSGTQFDPSIVDAIAAALARAELAGKPWRGDGTAYPVGAGTSAAGLADLPPGAVVAEFDHDDPAYQGPMSVPEVAEEVSEKVPDQAAAQPVEAAASAASAEPPELPEPAEPADPVEPPLPAQPSEPPLPAQPPGTRVPAAPADSSVGAFTRAGFATTRGLTGGLSLPAQTAHDLDRLDAVSDAEQREAP